MPLVVPLCDGRPHGPRTSQRLNGRTLTFYTVFTEAAITLRPHVVLDSKLCPVRQAFLENASVCSRCSVIPTKGITYPSARPFLVAKYRMNLTFRPHEIDLAGVMVNMFAYKN